MTAAPASPAASQQAAVDTALLILERMGLSPDDLTTATTQRLPIPTFADYVPVVSAAVTDGTRRAYGTYWNRITEQWGTRRLALQVLDDALPLTPVDRLSGATPADLMTPPPGDMSFGLGTRVRARLLLGLPVQAV